MARYATLQELKDFGRITTDNRDDQLQAVLSAAESFIDQFAGRSFTLDEEPSTRTFVVERDYVSVIVDDIGASGATYSDTNAQVVQEPRNALAKGEPVTSLRARYGWVVADPCDPTVEVTARWGYPSVPDPIRQATLIQANRLYKRADSPEGLAGFGNDGAAFRVTRLDPDVQALVRPYRRERLA
jgi:hypothetical protein